MMGSRLSVAKQNPFRAKLCMQVCQKIPDDTLRSIVEQGGILHVIRSHQADEKRLQRLADIVRKCLDSHPRDNDAFRLVLNKELERFEANGSIIDPINWRSVAVAIAMFFLGVYASTIRFL